MDHYTDAGVDYTALDSVKRLALEAASATSHLAAARGASVCEASRGESAFVLDLGGSYLGLVVECLGTKSLIAADYLDDSGVNCFDSIGYDTVAASVNDLVSVGIPPSVVNVYFAPGSAEWFTDESRTAALIDGFQAACRDAGAVWGGGETPALNGIVHHDQIDLGATSVGVISGDRTPILGEQLGPGSEIVLIASTGMHTNGASLARRVGAERPERWMTQLDDGTTFGAAVLTPSAIYVGVVEALISSGVGVHYCSHITGHGLRKLMRSTKDLTYRIWQVPPVPLVLQFIADEVGMTPHEAYATLNMGAGLALYCEPGSADAVLAQAQALGHEAIHAGVVEEGPKRVIIEPLAIEYEAADLQVR